MGLKSYGAYGDIPGGLVLERSHTRNCKKKLQVAKIATKIAEKSIKGPEKLQFFLQRPFGSVWIR